MTKLKRTQDEILKRIAEIKDDDFLGFETYDLVEYLDFEHAKPFLKDGVTSEDWKPTKKSPAKQIKDYMSFAWDKANSFRGISAGRSLSHMRAWIWLDGQDDFLDELNIMDYEFYGKDKLAAICNKYGMDSSQWDDGVRLNEEP